jgi:hypothetical protein
MKRRNVQLAFIGEVSPNQDTPDETMTGDEAIDIDLAGGKLMLVVPAGTPDERIFEAATMLGGELTLEDGRRLSFEIQGDAVGARFAVTEEQAQEEHQGLSSLGDIPGGV